MPKKSAKVIASVVEVRHAAPGEYRVEGSPGLLLHVSSAGNRSWVLRYQSPTHGRPRRMGLGAFPRVSLANAKGLADATGKLVAAGRDPLAERAERARAVSVGALCDQWLTMYADRERKSSKEERRIIDREIRPALGDIRANALTRRDVLTVIDAIGVRAPVQANRTLSTLRTVYNWAMSRDMVAANPTHGIKKAAETPRERTLCASELRALWHGLETVPDISALTRNAFRLQLLTACRIGEALGAAKAEFDLKRRLWNLPGTRTKNGKAHEIPLSKWACEIVREASVAAGDSQWLFPGEVSGKPVRRDTLKAEPIALRGALEMEPWRSHDLRRTVATWLGEYGFPAEVIERILNHSKQGVTDRHYNHAPMREPMRRALETWATALRKMVEGHAGVARRRWESRQQSQRGAGAHA
ncbi:MAG: tyrosine-type recombinase/integrase [Hyphomicrobium sp.]|uniref:tyrosine-type recombinase/integrase n=1 Tax=Hyphomicrobium sp. TaxID=82 RepID=UPI001328BA29|nr:site-specific integrase [Hyphomicrobium sp.]KAB2942956.1 MAG: tyrosine-type recombinase/integrase [Hyphomicrobium sp.]MBZ0211207.1 tyrosine-type recombinase/integrase [Hyphomicrobium sp.]